ncbi:MAG: HipA family kinase [Myxococcota bacterium]
MRTVQCTRYVTPLREGGSLPAIVEADDNGMYVMKLRGSGQGPKALIAELVGGELARALGLRVPELVFMQLDLALAKQEPDPEIQALLEASVGLNLALDYLPGSVSYDPAVNVPLSSEEASAVVWLDALITNVDRTARNTNMLLWHEKLWLIDHGAALYMHHRWEGWREHAVASFRAIKDHVLLPRADALLEADARLAPRVTPELLARIVADIPEAWLLQDAPFATAAEHRQAYVDYLLLRCSVSRTFTQEARDARASRV